MSLVGGSGSGRTWRIQIELVRELRREGFGGEEIRCGVQVAAAAVIAVPDDDVVAEAKIDNGKRRFSDGPR